MKRRVRVLLIAAALGLALPMVQIRPATAGTPRPAITCLPSSLGGNDGQFDCIIFGPAEGTLSMGSVWRPDPVGEPNIWRVRFYVNTARNERNVDCGPGTTGFTAKIGPFAGTRGVVGHCWLRSVT